MKIIITGGCGFLGTNIAAKAISLGHEVLILDNLSRSGAIANLTWLKEKGDFIFFHGDVRSQENVERAVNSFKPDQVFHLAGQVAMTTSLERPRLDFEINVLGTLNILEAIRTISPQTSLLYSSTNKVYGDLESLTYEEDKTRYKLVDFPEGVPETITLDFHSPYGCSKGAADQYILDYTRMYGLKAAVFRHSSMYGGRQFATYDQGWVGWFCKKAVDQSQGRWEKFTVSGTGKQVRDLLHAKDMVELYFLAATNIEKVSGQAFNIGGGIENSVSVLELLSFLQIELNSKLDFEHIAARESDQKVFVANTGKIRKSLGWSPRVDWRSGVRTMLEWVRTT